MKIRKILVAFLAVVLLSTSFMGNGIMAKAEVGEATSFIIGEDNVDLVLIPGETTHFTLPIQAIGTHIVNPTITFNTDTLPFSISKIELTNSNSNLAQTMISPYADNTYIEFDVQVKETAEIGNYKVGMDINALNQNDVTQGYNLKKDLVFKVLEEKAPTQLTIGQVTYKDAIVGHDTEISFVVKNEGEITARSAYVSMNYEATGGTKTDGTKIDPIVPKYTTMKIKLGNIAPGGEQSVSLPISIPASAVAGTKTIRADFIYKDVDGKSYTDTNNIYVTVEKNDSAPKLEIESTTYKGDLKAGDEFTIVTTLRNIGASRAENVTITIDDESIGADKFIKNYFTETIKISSIKVDTKLDAKVPLIISKAITGGVKALKINVTYTDEAGVKYTTTTTIYPEVTAADGMTADGNPNVVISSVKQSPEQPNAGGQLNVTFDIENKSQVDIKEIKISTSGLSSLTFSPIASEPYQYIEKLKAGEKKKITIELMVSKLIPEGLNNLEVKYSYVYNSNTGARVEVLPISMTIPILDVQNDAGSLSKPKLIISQYSTDSEELRAGSTFNFTFDIMNTNATVAAKNITITVSQAENIFALAKGSNSFFINKIAAGESSPCTLEFKVKSDAVTKAYPVEIKIEYEYDGAEPNPLTGVLGESKTETINLQAVENSRPVADNVSVYSMEGSVKLNSPALLSFEFYNMGKSPLNNVIARVEGDFTKAEGDMYFIGTVIAGGSSYVEFDVMPIIEGTAKGTLNITFEDSNGDEVSMTKDFESFVEGEMVWDPSMMEGMEGAFNPTTQEAKKAIVPLWLFILILVAVACIFIPVTRKVIINIYKGKLRKKEAENF